MLLEVIDQPNSSTIGEAIISGLTEENYQTYTHFVILCAYARKSGVSKLKEHVEGFRQNGGQVKVSVGIDNRITSIEALELLLDLSDDAFVFHNSFFGTSYHPKMYTMWNHEKAKVVIGSGNLTAGGLYTNYEIGNSIQLDLQNEEDKAIFNVVERAIQFYSNTESDLCKPLDRNLIDTMASQNLIIPEQRLYVRARSGVSRTEPLFGSQAPQRTPASTPSQPPTTLVGTTEGFWKKLSNSDVSLTSSPGQIIIPIRYLGLFPPMDELVETESGGKQSDVFFDVVIEFPDNERIQVNGARAILYTPAPDHPRQNTDLRFTFRSRQILERLESGSILKFQRTREDEYWFLVSFVPDGSQEHSRLVRTTNANFNLL